MTGRHAPSVPDAALPWSWRITRFDPSFRSPEGWWLRDDWTESFQIGQHFRGVKLTRDRYLAVEDAYCAALLMLFRTSSATGYRISGLSGPRYQGRRMPLGGGLGWQPGRRHWLHDGMRCSGHMAERRLEEICRLCLRGFAWCRVEEPGRFELHFGWDMYVYVASDRPSRRALQRIEALGLFPEPFVSPYRREMDV